MTGCVCKLIPYASAKIARPPSTPTMATCSQRQHCDRLYFSRVIDSACKSNAMEIELLLNIDTAVNRVFLPLAGGRLIGSGVPRVVCADRWCFRCVSRGNANRARMGMCFLDGYEALWATPTPAAIPSSSGHSYILHLVAVTMLCLALLAIAAGLGFGWLRSWRVAKYQLQRARRTGSSQLRRMRLSLRQSRDESRAPRLLSSLRVGARFLEIRPHSAAFAAVNPSGRHVVLRLDVEVRGRVPRR